jgi:hypothetical protein
VAETLCTLHFDAVHLALSQHAPRLPRALSNLWLVPSVPRARERSSSAPASIDRAREGQVSAKGERCEREGDPPTYCLTRPTQKCKSEAKKSTSTAALHRKRNVACGRPRPHRSPPCSSSWPACPRPMKATRGRPRQLRRYVSDAKPPWRCFSWLLICISASDESFIGRGQAGQEEEQGGDR